MSGKAPQRFDYRAASEYLGLSVRQVQRAVAAGKIAHLKLGGNQVTFDQQMLDDYVASCTVPAKR